ncbi:MAG: LemA family protein [Planctomycetes bacterium]|nr:LemA family protein [Planctomycetota bacterium]
MSVGIWIAIAVVVLLLLLIMGMYNSLVRKRIRCEESWSQIDVQLKRRYDLIPNLVETVKGYASHEKDTLERVIQARNAAMAATGVKEKAEQENFLTGALKQLFALSEAYPNLKANENFSQLQEELAGTENKISFSRQFYNECVATFNTARETFPSNIIAGLFGFIKKEYFELTAPAEREATKVKF